MKLNITIKWFIKSPSFTLHIVLSVVSTTFYGATLLVWALYSLEAYQGTLVSRWLMPTFLFPSLLFFVVKMKSGSDLEAQQVSRLNEYFLVVDRIWKVGCNARQGNNKLQNPNSGDGASILPPPINLKSFALANKFVGLSMQNNHASQTEANIPPPEGPTIEDPMCKNKALTSSTILGESARWSLLRKVTKVDQP